MKDVTNKLKQLKIAFYWFLMCFLIIYSLLTFYFWEPRQEKENI